jgi:integrase
VPGGRPSAGPGGGCAAVPRSGAALYQGLADRYVKPVIGSVRLDRLTPRHVQRLIVETRNAETSRGHPPSAATQRQIHTLIRNTLGDAYRLELVTRNVAAQVKAPPMARQRCPDLTVEDARHLLEIIEGERLEAFYVLALTTGRRRGELLGLRWADVDLNSRQLHVRRRSSALAASCGSSSPRPAHLCASWWCPSWQSVTSPGHGKKPRGSRSARLGGITTWQLSEDAADAIDRVLGA